MLCNGKVCTLVQRHQQFVGSGFNFFDFSKSLTGVVKVYAKQLWKFLRASMETEERRKLGRVEQNEYFGRCIFLLFLIQALTA